MNSLYSLIPVLSIILLGYVTKRVKIFDDYHTKGFELFYFRIAFPCYLLSVVMSEKFENLLNFRFISAYLITFAITFIIGFLVHLKNNSLKQKISLSLASSYSNTTIFLTPILFFLFDDGIAGVVANLLQVIVIQSSAILALAFISHRCTIKMFIKTFSTPVITIPIIGLLINYFGLQNNLKCINETVNIVAKSSSAIALFILGLHCTTVKFHSLEQKIKAFKTVVVKNFIHPIVALIVGYYIFKLDGYWLKSLIIAASSPTALIIYIISHHYKVDDDSIRVGIVVSCFTSIFTIILITLFL